MAKITDKCSVRVAVRIRPQSVSSSQGRLDACTTVALSRSQIAVGEDKAFTFDHVFDEQTGQEEVFERCVQQMVEGTFDGYNATILAYGQTGSGKTYTMGTSFKRLSDGSLGIIPRAAAHIFNGIQERQAEARENNKAEPMFEIVVQFIELYNEEIIDLLTSGKSPAPIRIVEDLVKAEISLNGATKIPVRSIEEMLRILHRGAQHRTTMATNMNQTSSRSHAVFSVFVKQTRELENDADVVELSSQDTGIEFLSSKLHFVDLAGSERLKKTGATGDRAKESISINSGLLALGNVISILGAPSKATPAHVPYRNSKLTRLLQDSLGGNSRTLMIACVSSSLTDHAETLNTLQYANRAKNISNKVIANQAKKHRGRECAKVPIMSRVNPSRVFKPLPACQLKGPNVTKTILRQREQLAKLPGYSLSNSKISTTTRYGPHGASGEQQSKKIEELKAELEKANAAVRIANAKNERLNRENSVLRQKILRLEGADNPGNGIASVFQSSQRQRIPIRKTVQKRRSRSMVGKPGPGGFYVPICLLPTPKTHGETYL